MKNSTGNVCKNSVTSYEVIGQATEQGKLADALSQIEQHLQETPGDAHLHYLRGNVFMKRGEWGAAMSCFKHAASLDAESPATEVLAMLTDIMNFYNKDMYNQ